MNIVFYRNKSDGKIRYCHEVKDSQIPPGRDGWSDKIAEYNKNSKSNTAELYIMAPGSFEEYLWDNANAVKRLNKETLYDLESDLNRALDVVRDLMCQLEHTEKG